MPVTVTIGDFSSVNPAAPAGYDLLLPQVDRSGAVPEFSFAVPRATTAVHGTIIYDASGSAYKYLGADGNWHSAPQTIAAAASQWLKSYDQITGLFTQTQPVYSDLSGSPTLAQTIAAVASKWLRSYDASTGLFTASQPVLSDDSDVLITSPANNDVLTYETSSSKWKNKVAAGSVSTTGSPVSGNLAKFSGASSITNADLSGDVTTAGTAAATVAKIQGTSVDVTAPTDGQVLVYDNASGKWKPGAIGGSGGAGLPNWLKYHPDNYPASPSADDDEFEEALLANINANWATLNSNAAMVFSLENGRLKAVPTSDNGTFRGYEQALPTSGSWAFVTKLSFIPQLSINQFAGIFLRESGSGKLLGYYFGYPNPVSSILRLDRWTASGVTFDTVLSSNTAFSVGTWYLKIFFDGTSYSFSHSIDGIAFFVDIGRAATTDFTVKADKVGLGVVNGAAGVQNPVWWEFFRKTL